MEQKISWVHVDDHYDHHISGWVRLAPTNRFHYFKLTSENYTFKMVIDEDDGEEYEECEEHLVYSIYEVPKRLAFPHIVRIRDFRHLVGWLWDYAPLEYSRWNQPRPSGPRVKYDTMRVFYDVLTKPPAIDLTQCRLIGTTTDLKTVALI